LMTHGGSIDLNTSRSDNNATGFTGVFELRGKFWAQIQRGRDEKTESLGSFETAEEASHARESAKNAPRNVTQKGPPSFDECQATLKKSRNGPAIKRKMVASMDLQQVVQGVGISPAAPLGQLMVGMVTNKKSPQNWPQIFQEFMQSSPRASQALMETVLASPELRAKAIRRQVELNEPSLLNYNVECKQSFVLSRKAVRHDLPEVIKPLEVALGLSEGSLVKTWEKIKAAESSVSDLTLPDLDVRLTRTDDSAETIEYAKWGGTMSLPTALGRHLLPNAMRDQLHIKADDTGAGIICLKLCMDACLVLKNRSMSSLAAGILNMESFTSHVDSFFAVSKWWGDDSADMQLVHTKAAWEEIESLMASSTGVHVKGLSGAMVKGSKLPELFKFRIFIVPDGKARCSFLHTLGTGSNFPLAASCFHVSMKKDLHFLSLPITATTEFLRGLRNRYVQWLVGREDTESLQKRYASQISFGAVPVEYRISGCGAELTMAGPAHKEWRSSNLCLTMTSKVAGAMGLLNDFISGLRGIGFKKTLEKVRSSHILSRFSDGDLRVLMGEGKMQQLLNVLPAPYNMTLQIFWDLLFDYIKVLRGDKETSQNVTSEQLLYDGQVIMTIFQVIWGPAMTPSLIELCLQTGFYWQIGKKFLDDAGLRTLPRHLREETADTAHVPLLKAGVKNVGFNEKQGVAGKSIQDSFLTVDRKHQKKQENSSHNVTASAQRLARKHEVNPREQSQGLDALCDKMARNVTVQSNIASQGMGPVTAMEDTTEEAVEVDTHEDDEEDRDEDDEEEDRSELSTMVNRKCTAYVKGVRFVYDESVKEESIRIAHDDECTSGIVDVDMAYTKSMIESLKRLPSQDDLRFVSALHLLTDEKPYPLIGISLETVARVIFNWSHSCVEIILQEKASKDRRTLTFDFRSIAMMRFETSDIGDKIHISMGRRPHVIDRMYHLDISDMSGSKKIVTVEQEPTYVGEITKQMLESYCCFEIGFKKKKKHDITTSVIPEMWLENDMAVLKENSADCNRFLTEPGLASTWPKHYPPKTVHDRLPPMSKASEQPHIHMMMLSMPERIYYVVEDIVKRAEIIKRSHPSQPCRNALSRYTRPLLQKTREAAKRALEEIPPTSTPSEKPVTKTLPKVALGKVKVEVTEKQKASVEDVEEDELWMDDVVAFQHWLQAQKEHWVTLRPVKENDFVAFKHWLQAQKEHWVTLRPVKENDFVAFKHWLQAQKEHWATRRLATLDAGACQSTNGHVEDTLRRKVKVKVTKKPKASVEKVTKKPKASVEDVEELAKLAKKGHVECETCHTWHPVDDTDDWNDKQGVTCETFNEHCKPRRVRTSARGNGERSPEIKCHVCDKTVNRATEHLHTNSHGLVSHYDCAAPCKTV